MKTIDQLDRFVRSADAYCRARREYLDIKKRMVGAMGRCEYSGMDGEEYFPPCCHWENGCFDDISEWCDMCEMHYADAHRRDKLRTKFSGLMRAMLKAWKEWEGA